MWPSSGMPDCFDYEYFDDPDGYGYRGYHHRQPGDPHIRPWEIAARYCRRIDAKSVLDIGCGKGFLVEKLLSYGIEAKGCDVSSYALSFAAHLPCNLRSATEVPIDNQQVIVILGVLMYLTHDELNRFLRRLFIAEPDLIIVSVFSNESKERMTDINRKINESKSWWKAKFQSESFQFVSCGRSFSVVSPVVSEFNRTSGLHQSID